MAFTTLFLTVAFSPKGLMIWLIMGLVVGFVASKIMTARAYGLAGDIIAGLVGASIGGILSYLLLPNTNFGIWNSTIVAMIGSYTIIGILRAFAARRI